MLEDIEETVQPLLEMVRKGDKRTLAEDRRMESSIKSLMQCDSVKDDTTITGTRYMTKDQLEFVHYILPTAIRRDIPKLEEMMRVYGLSLRSVFRYEQSQEDYDACAANWR